MASKDRTPQRDPDRPGNDENVVIPERAHDQPAEGGREQGTAAESSATAGGSGRGRTPDPEAAGIVDQQGAALRSMEQNGAGSGDPPDEVLPG